MTRTGCEHTGERPRVLQRALGAHAPGQATLRSRPIPPTPLPGPALSPLPPFPVQTSPPSRVGKGAGGLGLPPAAHLW